MIWTRFTDGWPVKWSVFPQCPTHTYPLPPIRHRHGLYTSVYSAQEAENADLMYRLREVREVWPELRWCAFQVGLWSYVPARPKGTRMPSTARGSHMGLLRGVDDDHTQEARIWLNAHRQIVGAWCGPYQRDTRAQGENDAKIAKRLQDMVDSGWKPHVGFSLNKVSIGTLVPPRFGWIRASVLPEKRRAALRLIRLRWLSRLTTNGAALR